MRARTKRTGQHGGAHLHIDLSGERRATRPIELPGVEVGPSVQCHRGKNAEWTAAMSESGPSCRSSKGLGSARSALVAGFARIELMTPCELLDLAWSYPLFEALYGRRSRRSGPAFRIPGGPLPHRCPPPPGPPSWTQEAPLVRA